MRNRFWRRLYTIQEIKLVDGHLRYVTNEDGTLFADIYRTKIKPEDLPEWFLYGRYYKRFGFLTAKGITDLLYIPSRFSNHYLKDDYLLIAYEMVWGREIITILKGAKKYSGYDIGPFLTKLKWKKSWLQATYPDEFGPDKWDNDVDKLFEEEP